MSKNGFKVMDSDMHLHEPWDLWLKHLAPEYRDRAPVGMSKNPMDMNTAIQGKPLSFLANADIDYHEEEEAHEVLDKERGERYLREGIERGFDPVSQLHAMDIEGVDVSLLLPTRGMLVAGKDYDDAGYATALSRAYNDWLSDFCKEDPKRMKGAAMILVTDIQEAVREVRRASKELGFLSIYLHPNPIKGRNWHNPDYYPIWEECQSLGMAVTFHETFKCSLPQAMTDRFLDEPDKIWTMGHVACHVVEQLYACLCMCTGGVLERFPDLQVAFLECNSSWLPFWLWRMDGHYELRQRWASKYISMKPSEYFKRQCYVGIDADEEPAKYAMDWIGDDNFVFSTDYPHSDSKYPHATDTFLALPLTEESKRKVLWDNCARLYNLSG
ncbi:MAG: amidohydrolase [Chloroflexi bacterium]|nr:amidohydrolase [Chloroflexota bacterium]